MNKSVGIVGFGFVGSAIYNSLKFKNANVEYYDKYKCGGVKSLEDMLDTNILFLCLPTKFNNLTKTYDKSAIYDVACELDKYKYNGSIIIKSTVEPQTTETLAQTYPDLNFIHNPEFLTAATASYDFHNQTHIVLGKSATCTNNHLEQVKQFYENNYPDAKISISTSTESECMKIFVNCFYASKIQIFNEFYSLCKKMNADFDKVKDMMLNNEWINPMHTNVPGTDGLLSYGGLCFPKDTNALLNFMKTMKSPNKVLESVVIERNEMRMDNDNIINHS